MGSRINLMLCLFLLALAVNGCPVIEILRESCIHGTITCNIDEVLQIQVYEDCPKNEMILRVTDELNVIEDCGGQLNVFENEFGFVRVDDLENPMDNDLFFCFESIALGDGFKYSMNIKFSDVDEFPPLPSAINIYQTVELNENAPQGVLYQFGYEDFDYGEIETIKVNFTNDAHGFFSLEKLDLTDNIQMFGLIANGNLDFETESFYDLDMVFTTNDERQESTSTKQILYILIQDVGDFPPIFTTPCPSRQIPETNDTSGSSVCTIAARDGDFMVNNTILYSIDSFTPAYGSDFFEIDEATGEISVYAPIDRESLTTTTFSLLVVAREVLKDGTTADEPNSSSQITNIYITDVNDNLPRFDQSKYEADMEEFNAETSDINDRQALADLTIQITDNDEGSAGQYVITSNYENSILLNPTSGFGQTNISVIVVNKENIFDYERNDPEGHTVTVILTATEEENIEHRSTAELLIHIRDINDNVPTFEPGNYGATVDENTPPSTSIAVVKAHDADVSPKFNTVTYALPTQQDCTEFLEINRLTGVLNVAKNAILDYEQNPSIDCQIRATDRNFLNKFDLNSEVVFVLTLRDINDENPSFVNFETSLNVAEDEDPGYILTTINVIDVDSDAIVRVVMSFSDNQDEEVESWFNLEIAEASTNQSYVGHLVIKSSLNREALSEDSNNQVKIEFTAEDINANGMNKQQEQRTLTIFVDDVNDEFPSFDKDYSSLSYDENTAIDTVVIVIRASDTDENDSITYTISDNEYLQIIDDRIGNISIKSSIDREETPKFIATLTVTDLMNHNRSIETTFFINDLNDNTPIFDNSCLQEPFVSEGDDDGVEIATVHATDKDSGIHSDISYILQNTNSLDNNAPFLMNISTGVITVNNSNGLLDREMYPQWPLIIEAVDGCGTEELQCKTNRNQCYMNVIIVDINDESPGSYKLNTGDDVIITDEDLREDEEINHLQIMATDLDQPGSANAEIDFQAVALFFLENDENEFQRVNQLFKTDNFNLENSCTLLAIQNLTHLRGDYVITIMGTDLGENPIPSYHNFSLVIKDTNDNVPLVKFSTCLRSNENSITIIENDAPTAAPLDCDPGGGEATIFVTDLDEPNTSNSDVFLRINRDLSSCIDGADDNQLNDFEIFDYGDNQKFGIQLNEKSVMDREKGSLYELDISALDQGIPTPLETNFKIYVTIRDQNEFPPTFCDQGSDCNIQILDILENCDDAVEFSPAIDKDNTNGDGSFVDNNKVFYYITDSGSDPSFFIPDPTVNSLKPRIDLDRENTSRYNLTILASNYDKIDVSSIVAIDQLLPVIVNILDENDIVPHFNETIFGAYLNNGHKGDPVAIVEFYDEDLNETLTYTIDQNIIWDPSLQDFEEPFKVVRNTSRRSEIVLNMDPIGSTGQCSFIIYCQDANPEHKPASTMVQVFVVTDEFLIPFYFKNDIVTVNSQINEVEDILSDVFNYKCQIDAISEATDSSNEKIQGETIVYAHFIDVIDNESEEISADKILNEFTKSPITTIFTKNKDQRSKGKVDSLYGVNGMNSRAIERNDKRKKITARKSISTKSSHITRANAPGIQYQLVPEQEIEDLATDGAVANELITDFENLGLHLIQIGIIDTTTTTQDYQQTIITLKIIIAAVSFGLGLILLLLAIAYWHNTVKLKRQLKVMSVKTFGSKSSGLENAGFGISPVPGSNVYAREKTNPVLNLEELPSQPSDTSSISSDDSILAGVEENPEFMNYIESRRTLYEIKEVAGREEDAELPAYSPPTRNIMLTRQNPLTATSYQNTNPDGLQIIYGKTENIEETSEIDSIDEPWNSNFSLS